MNFSAPILLKKTYSEIDQLTMKTGVTLVKLLERYGVDTVFGIPGTHSLELYRGLSQSTIRHILPRHEQGGGFMADGYARLSGKPGVCFVITGAGVTNITTALGEAYMDSVPLLLISPVNPPDGGKVNRGRLHEITDQSAVTAPLTAFSATVQTVDELPQLIARAFAVFASERPRPVHISVPLPLLRQDIDANWEALTLPAKPVTSQEQLDTAEHWLTAAQRPIIIAGGGCRFCSPAITALAEKFGCPVITSVAGRGVIANSHPLCPGAQLRAEPVQQLLAASDLALLLGTELAPTDRYNDDLAIPERQIRVNLNPDVLLANASTLAIQADVGDFAVRLASQLSTPNAIDSASDACHRVRASIQDAMSAKEKQHCDVVTTVQKALPEDTVVVSDMTQLAYSAIDFIPLETPNSWLHPTGYGTLGYALPAAIGACLAAPQRPVLAIVGDAGLQYTMQELTLAAELRLNLTLLLWNNDALQQIRDDMDAAGIQRLAIQQRNPDFIALAQACGWRGKIANSLDELVLCCNEAQQQDGTPYLIQLNEYQL